MDTLCGGVRASRVEGWAGEAGLATMAEAVALTADGDRVACIRRYGQDSGLAFVRRVDGTDTPVRVGTRGVFVRGVSVSPRGDSLALAIGGGDASGGDDVWLAHVDSLHAPRPFLNAT